jgi:hypothetical protein
MNQNKIRLNVVLGGIIVGIILLGIVGYIIFFPIIGRTSWSSRDERSGLSIGTCWYEGIWIMGTPIRIVVREKCMMI